MMDSEALLKELLAVFELEAQEHIGAISSLLLTLERAADQGERRHLLEQTFRRMHTLKGAAHAVNQADLAQGCQELENLLADLKRGDLELDLPLFDRLHAEVDALSARVAGASSMPTAAPAAALSRAATAAPFPPPAVPADVAAKKAQHAQEQATETTPAGEPRPASPRGDETVRVSTRLLETLLLQSEELVAAKLAASALQEELSAASAELAGRTAERNRALELARKALKHAPPEAQQGSLAALLEQSCRHERLAEGRLRQLEKRADKHLRALGGMIDPLLEDMKKLHLLPFSSIAEPLSKLVRDLARELFKEAELLCAGTEIEIDRRILAELKEPLLHLVRNMVDHGIEEPAKRLAQGKPEKGSIVMELRMQDANRAELVLRDDGRGIHPARVKEAALSSELAGAEALERMPDAEALQLIFESGVSTSRKVSTISGRGVGLAIVRDSLERLGGHVSVESEPGRGTVFRLVFPLSFAMMRGLLVQAGGRDCIIPAANVELSSRAASHEVKRVENRETVLVGGEVVSLVPLARVLELHPSRSEAEGAHPFVLLRSAEKRIAFAVDQVVEVQEILVKPLGRQLSRVRNVAGATVLGSGRVVPVLNVADLFRSALQAPSPLPLPPEDGKPGRLSVLVAEDSITSRTLLKNILEASGFLVRTAIDGADALTQLKTEGCDVVVSDVEMPRMDGFQLTSAIRADSRFASIPVILVTGLESRGDRERGIDVGASAYLVKSSFDQGSLIDVIRKLT